MDATAVSGSCDDATPPQRVELLEHRIKVERRHLEFLLTADKFVDTSGRHVFEQISARHGILSIGTDPNFKLGARSKKAPTVRVVALLGMEQELMAARVEVESLFDTKTNRITLKVEVPQDLHFYVIGKKGENIKDVMVTTGCHIHFPDTNRPNRFRNQQNTGGARDQVSISGSPECVERARHLLRGLLPITISFEVPAAVDDSRITMCAEVTELAKEFGVTIFFKQRANLRPLALVKGMRKRASVVMAAARRLLFVWTGTESLERCTLQADLPVSLHASIIGTGGATIQKVMEVTHTGIRFPDATQASTVFITGSTAHAHATHLFLHGLQPLVLMFELTEAQTAQVLELGASCMCQPEEVVRQAEHGLAVGVAFRWKSPDACATVYVKTTEATASHAYHARVRILHLAGATVFGMGSLNPHFPGFNDLMDDPNFYPPSVLVSSLHGQLRAELGNIVAPSEGTPPPRLLDVARAWTDGHGGSLNPDGGVAVREHRVIVPGVSATALLGAVPSIVSAVPPLRSPLLPPVSVLPTATEGLHGHGPPVAYTHVGVPVPPHHVHISSPLGAATTAAAASTTTSGPGPIAMPSTMNASHMQLVAGNGDVLPTLSTHHRVAPVSMPVHPTTVYAATAHALPSAPLEPDVGGATGNGCNGVGVPSQEDSNNINTEQTAGRDSATRKLSSKSSLRDASEASCGVTPTPLALNASASSSMLGESMESAQLENAASMSLDLRGTDGGIGSVEREKKLRQASIALTRPVTNTQARRPNSYWSGDWLSRSMPEASLKAMKGLEFQSSLAPMKEANSLEKGFGNGRQQESRTAPSSTRVSRLDDMPCSPFGSVGSVSSMGNDSSDPERSEAHVLGQTHFDDDDSENGLASPGVPLQSSRRVGVPLALSEMGGAKKERVEKFWSVTSVEQLLTKLDLAKYVTTFNEEEIDFVTLLMLTDADLQEIGVKTFGARKKILLAVAEIRHLRLSDMSFLSNMMDLDATSLPSSRVDLDSPPARHRQVADVMAGTLPMHRSEIPTVSSASSRADQGTPATPMHSRSAPTSPAHKTRSPHGYGAVGARGGASTQPGQRRA